MTINADLTQFRTLIIEAMQIAVNKTLTELDLIDPYMSMYAACKKYPKSDVERYIAEGVIERHRDGAGKKWKLNRIALEIAFSTENRIAHLTHNS